MSQFARIQASRSSLIRADISVLCIVIILGIGVIQLVETGSKDFVAKVEIDTSLASLPGYALLSFIRSIFALALSYIFAIIYGSLAANKKSLEKILIPLLDVLQSLPVIAFLPGFVLALISMFENSRWGLEIACILTIFTGQVWNLAFAYYESQRTLKPELIEVAKICHLNKIQKLFLVDLPNGRQPLIYNGMMSMAGGWFFLTTCEAFTLGNRDFRLPGLGSFLSDCFDQAKYLNFGIGLFTLVLVIVGTDFLLWRPLIAWVAKFKDSDSENTKETESWFLNLIQATDIPSLLSNFLSSTLRIIIPKKKLSTSESPTDYILQEINKLGMVFHISDEKIKKIKQSSLVPWLVTFSVGGIVFSILPGLPILGHSLMSVT
ncbi:MAG: ABC transporter permease subunit, partial [Silvanigrellaceae bacterium]|nr:ABC transporter permease subunit [Silvanigrellaceae bacterium]